MPHESPKSVRIYEVGPRDGLQNEKAFITTEDKLSLIAALNRAGPARIEITSFVHPRWIPALADADRVAAHAVTAETALHCIGA